MSKLLPPRLRSHSVGEPVPHAWNTTFTWRSPQPPFRRVTEAQAEQFDREYLTIWLALTDATEDNGCPVVAPGVHRLGTLAHTYVEPLGFECFSDPPRVVTAPVPVGGAAVFSSLTPHLTGPNLTDEVRKAYILQYAPLGAETLVGDPRDGAPPERRPCDDPERQFAVLRGGEPV